MAIIRPALPQLAFTMVPNAWVRDPNLTPDCVGLLTYLLSHAEGYRCSVSQMARENGVGRDAVDSILRRLKARGYLVAVQQQRSEGGRIAENDYTITDHTQGPPPLPADPEESGQNVRSEPIRSAPSTVAPSTAGPSSATPGRRRTRGEHQQENVTELPPADARPTPGQRANKIARAYVDSREGMAPFHAVRNIVTLAVKAPAGYTDEQISAGLVLLTEQNRGMTAANLKAALDGELGRQRGTPYRDPADPTAYHQPL